MSHPAKYIDLIRTSKDSPASEDTNLYRRNLLKLFLVGGGGFLLGKFIEPVMHFVQGDKIVSTKEFENFKFEETNKELRVLDKEGEEILIVDKDSLSL
jgi:hypothetical protein